MPRSRNRLDPPEPRDSSATHWGLFELLAGVRRTLEGKHQAEQGPHVPMPAQPVKVKPPER